MSDSKKVYEVFDTVCDLPAEERESMLRELCEDDAELRREVETLLASDDHPITALDEMPVRLSVPHMPARIGDYEILGLLGSGGMGVVYEAMQRTPHRRVALKVVRSTLVSSAHVRRFESEAEVLGWLNHPGIATVYEAGTAQLDGTLHPYLAMELVVGFPLGRYASESGLGIEARVELIARVADAVHHAHQKGVIHRDLKPGNILVDGSGTPKVLDFGIARVTDADLTSATGHTESGEILGTLPYMSPEQVQGDASELDTRSDVYALGVVLYELLSGQKPLDVSTQSIPVAVRRIVEEDPVPLGRIDARLRGDLEVLCQKALEKDKERRYGSAADFAADLRRYLANEPIHARPASAAYQFQKFARRNRFLVGGIASTLIALIAGFIGTTTFALRASEQAELAWNAEKDARDAENEARGAELEARQSEKQAKDAEQQAREAETKARKAELRATEAAEEAQRQADVALAVNDFLNQDLLATVAPSAEIGKGRDVRMREVLDAAASRIDQASAAGGRFADKPAVEAEIRATLGDTYQRLGLLDEASLHSERALALFRETLGDEDPRTLRAITAQAWLQIERRERIGEAERTLRETWKTSEAVQGPGHEDTLALRMRLGSHLMFSERYVEAAQHLEETLAIAVDSLGNEHPMTIGIRSNLGTVYGYQVRLQEAEEILTEAIEQGKRVLGHDHPDVLITRSYHAAMVMRLNRDTEAHELYLDIIDVAKRVLGPDHPQTLVSCMNLGLTYLKLGDLENAQTCLLDVYERQNRVLGAEHSNTIYTRTALIELTYQLENYAESERLVRENMEVLAASPGAEPLMSLLLEVHLLNILGELERWDELEDQAWVVDRVLATRREINARIEFIRETLAYRMVQVGAQRLVPDDAPAERYQAALRLVERGYNLTLRKDEVHTDLAFAYYRNGKFAEAYQTQIRALESLPMDSDEFDAYEERLIVYEEAMGDQD